jgi:hypothetical protein
LGGSQFNQGNASNGLIVVLWEKLGRGEFVEKFRVEMLPSARKTWSKPGTPLPLGNMDVFFETKQRLKVDILEWDCKRESSVTPPGEAPSGKAGAREKSSAFPFQRKWSRKLTCRECRQRSSWPRRSWCENLKTFHLVTPCAHALTLDLRGIKQLK